MSKRHQALVHPLSTSWGSNTQINKWGGGKITYKLLYRTLTQWDNLIGFWRPLGRAALSGQCPRLIVFEWGPSFVSGSRICPYQNGSYHVTKAPFLWMGISPRWANRILSRSEGCNSKDVLRKSPSSKNLIEASDEVIESGTAGSLPDRFVSEMYSCFANKTSPVGDRGWRKQRKKEKERQGMRKWEPEHFVKVVDCSPTQDPCRIFGRCCESNSFSNLCFM
ncbi:GATA type zinc finger transcription factor family protein [Hibiscus syriacus]|uniref:GATA type zinc finger transcription factor family protein n=1 Tax=Hibiscus syriacus TaxID=106335 RepID=A0A6A2WTJ7_HIBSY|nr:GATA type zinc finger transcription factor family protein [Hibiscus syriacus]